MIHIQHLQVTFSPRTPLEKRVFKDFSLTIPTGQFVSVIGSNGAGKSTLLNTVSGEVSSASGLQRGQVTIAGHDVTHQSVPQRAKFVSRVFQNPLAGSCAELTVEENLVLAQNRARRLGLRKATGTALRREFRERLSRLGLGLENRLGDQMGLLSGGQRQAVSLVMATLAPTQVLLLDEHTAALDPKTAKYILSLTASLVAEQKLTALMVTHSMQQAIEVGDRLLMLHEGETVLDVEGEQKTRLSVGDLLDAFASQTSGRAESVADDALLLG